MSSGPRPNGREGGRHDISVVGETLTPHGVPGAKSVPLPPGSSGESHLLFEFTMAVDVGKKWT